MNDKTNARRASVGDCFLCGKPLNKANPVYLQDDDYAVVYVGPDCYTRVVKSGYDGARDRSGHGPLVFVERRFAEAYMLRGSAGATP